jgi:alpha-amylase
MKKFSIPFVFVALIFSLIGCQNNKSSNNDNNQIDGHPA